MPQVIIILGSDSDLEVFKASNMTEVLSQVGITYEISIISAHRNPDELKEYVLSKASTGVPPVFIAPAGRAAALPGAIASHIRDAVVIGVALPSPEYPNAEDAMLSITRMPKGIPVAFAGVGKAGLVNAAILSCQIQAMLCDKVGYNLRRYLKIVNNPPIIGFDEQQSQ